MILAEVGRREGREGSAGRSRKCREGGKCRKKGKMGTMSNTIK